MKIEMKVTYQEKDLLDMCISQHTAIYKAAPDGMEWVARMDYRGVEIKAVPVEVESKEEVEA